MPRADYVNPNDPKDKDGPRAVMPTTGQFWLGVAGFLFTGVVATVPVALPFGNPFRKDGPNGIELNWAYYFWYNLIGWGGLWMKIVLCQCFVWDVTFFIPLLQPSFNDKRLFVPNGSLVAVICSSLFAVLFYLVGYWIFLDPVPFGTISFGVPCFVVNFIFIIALVVPKEKRKNLEDYIHIIKSLCPFVIWVGALCGYTFLAWLLDYYARKEVGDDPTVMAIGGAVFLGNYIIEGILIMIPSGMFFGTEKQEIACIWRMAYFAQFNTFVLWMYPGFPSLPAVLLGGRFLVMAATGAWMWKKARQAVAPGASEVVSMFGGIQGPKGAAADLCVNVFLDAIACFFTSAGFLMIFAYNSAGPNKEYMYLIDDMSQSDFEGGCMWIAIGMVVVLLYIGSLYKMIHLQGFPEEIRMKTIETITVLMTEYYFLIWWIFVSSALACGACMVMKHDGMDLTFQFKEWSW